jgi:hypothetical protein
MRHKIVMLETAKGADDGLTVQTYEQGKQYLVSKDLLNCFLDAGVCRLLRVDAAAPDALQTAVQPKLETKPRFPWFFSGKKI